MSTRWQAVFFDLDGTLADTLPGLRRAVNDTLRRHGMPPATDTDMFEWIGGGMDVLIHRAMQAGLNTPNPPETLLAQARKQFSETYAAHMVEGSSLYPGAAELLEQLKHTGVRLACITNKSEKFTLPLLQALGIADCFDLVFSSESLPARKPDPLPLLEAAHRFEAPPVAALMVGDSINDIRAARSGGFPVAAVSYGYHNGDIRELEPDLVIDSLLELAADGAAAPGSGAAPGI